MKASELFSDQARALVSQAVHVAESRTSGEIVCRVAERSDNYADVRALLGALLAFAAGVAVLGLGLDARFWLPPVQLAWFAVGFLAIRSSALLRALAPAALRAERVARAAHLAFLGDGLVETRDRTGILIYVSLLERSVEVLADRGIHGRVEPGTWDGVVSRIVAGMQSGRAEQGLVDAIAHCGELLAAHFPPRPGDTNEISDELRV